MQIDESQTGISCAIPRFSHWLVAVGQVPSAGNALTGSKSPFPASIIAVTRLTNSGAFSDIEGNTTFAVASAGTATSCRFANALSTPRQFRLTASSPFLA